MQTTLAGYNIDVEIIELVKRILSEYKYGSVDSPLIEELLSTLADEPLTPETISAAYARISRSELGVADLRKDSRSSIARARRSNENIVFGFGHSSVAEHAMFNFDITDASRLAIEALEAHRLASYTESSQRYIAMSGDYIVPEEIATAGFGEEYSELCDELFAGYRAITEMLEKQYAEFPRVERNTKTREDARYVLPMSCRSQVGVTVNARNLEYMIKSFNTSPLAEVREMGRQLLQVTKRVAPSLIRYTEPNRSLEAADRFLSFTSGSIKRQDPGLEGDSVQLIDYPQQKENHALSAMLFTVGKAGFSEYRDYLAALSENEKRKYVINAHKCISAHESLRREMELGVFTFSITLSATAFAQFKRHRIATLIKQMYLPELGVSVPESVSGVGGKPVFDECIEKSNSMYHKLYASLPEDQISAAEYALTNAHRRRILFQASARELNHFARLRQDKHAQWDIRMIANEMIDKAREACPNLMLFATGKDGFDQLSEKLFTGS